MPDSLPAVIPAFDYASVPPAARSILKRTARVVQAALRRTTEDMIGIGKALCEAKEELEHGEFEAWIVAEAGMSVRSARNFMALAERFGNSANIAELALPPTAVMRLANAPREAFAEAVRRSRAGERLRVADVEGIIRERRSAEGGAPAAESPDPVGGEEARHDRAGDQIRLTLGLLLQLIADGRFDRKLTRPGYQRMSAAAWQLVKRHLSAQLRLVGTGAEVAAHPDVQYAFEALARAAGDEFKVPAPGPSKQPRTRPVPKTQRAKPKGKAEKAPTPTSPPAPSRRINPDTGRPYKRPAFLNNDPSRGASSDPGANG